MSERSQAIDFLANIQQAYISYGGITPLGLRYNYIRRPFASEKNYEMVKAQMAEKGYPHALDDYRTFIAGIEVVKGDYSPFEHIMNISLLESAKKRIKSVLAFSKIPFPENVVLGTSQFGHVNAIATAPSSSFSIRVILLDEGLFLFLNGLAKIISELFEKQDEANNGYSFSFQQDDIERSLVSNEEAHVKFVDLISAYFITGHSVNAKKFITDYQHNHFASLLRDTAETFILAHEYGHVFYGHLDHQTDEQESFNDHVDLETWQTNWSMEFQADLFASMIVIRHNHHLKNESAAASFAGIYFLFSTLEMLDVVKGYQPSETHPAPKQRLVRLLECLDNDTPDKGLIENVRRFGKSIEYTIQLLFFINDDEIKRLIKEAVGK